MFCCFTILNCLGRLNYMCAEFTIENLGHREVEIYRKALRMFSSVLTENNSFLTLITLFTYLRRRLVFMSSNKNCNQLQCSGYLENGKILLVGKLLFLFCSITAFDLVPPKSNQKIFWFGWKFQGAFRVQTKDKNSDFEIFFSPRAVKFSLIITKLFINYTVMFK
jgi:hypothetical protein